MWCSRAICLYKVSTFGQGALFGSTWCKCSILLGILLCIYTLSKYYVHIYIQVLLSLLILKSIVFVSVCLRNGLFAWTSTHWTSYCMLSASGAGILKWPASALVVKEMSRVGGKHLCANLFKDDTLDLQVSVPFIWYTCSCTHNMSTENWFSNLTTLNTAVDGNTNPPLCLKAVNLAHKGPTDSFEAWASVGSSSSSPLHVSQETFARSDRTSTQQCSIVIFSFSGCGLLMSLSPSMSSAKMAFWSDVSMTGSAIWLLLEKLTSPPTCVSESSNGGAIPCFWWLNAVFSQDSLQCIFELQTISETHTHKDYTFQKSVKTKEPVCLFVHNT